jgi:hypothetical protein
MNLLKELNSYLVNMDRYKFGPLVLFPMLGIMLIGFSIYSLDLLNSDLKDLSIIENGISTIRFDRNNLIVKLNDSNNEFITNQIGIAKDLKRAEYIKIFYKNRLFFPRQLIIYQLEKNDMILIDFEMKKQESLLIMIVCFILGFVFLGINYLYRKRIDK